ncbi:MAG: cytochrome d ubiquinol oxidase subunit II [Selenomonadaceae bacterium]|nr:cytochrome d ubiquinol oxidase subunit II [Selenomonadaceae bacterium]
MELTLFWFILIAVLFVGFFVLEGFDYGVGILLPFTGKSDRERRLIIRTIGPVWDGNEVWMITAGGALFAAFPHVYATMFSGFYLALFLMLMALIMRGVAFELRDKHQALAWRRTWDGAIFFGSFLPAFLWGVAVTDLLAGVPIGPGKTYQGNFLDLLTVYSILGGLTFLLVFAYHGAAFLGLRLSDEGLKRRAKLFGQRLGGLAILSFVLFMAMTHSHTDLFAKGAAAMALIAAAAVFVLGYLALQRNSFKGAFALSSGAIALTTAAVFLGLFPRLMVSSLNPAWSLTVENAASTPYTLSVMTVAAVCLVPVVLIYQGWCYYVFRRRISDGDLGH